MKKVLFVIAASTLLFASPLARGASQFGAVLSGDQEVPPVVTIASGSASLSLNDAQTRLEMSIQLVGLDLDGNQTPGTGLDDVTGLHIHSAPAGVNGGVVFGLISPNNDANGDLLIDPVAGTLFSAWDLSEGNGTTLDAQLGNLFSDGLYINVHTVANAGGEIRGQITLVPEPTSFALLLLPGLGWFVARTFGLRSRLGQVG